MKRGEKFKFKERVKPQPGKFPVLLEPMLVPTAEARVAFEFKCPDIDPLLDMFVAKLTTIARQTNPAAIRSMAFISIAAKIARSKLSISALPLTFLPLLHIHQHFPAFMIIVSDCFGDFTLNGRTYIIDDALDIISKLIVSSALVREADLTCAQAWKVAQSSSYDNNLGGIDFPFDFTGRLNNSHRTALTWLLKYSRVLVSIQGRDTMISFPSIIPQDVSYDAFIQRLQTVTPAGYRDGSLAIARSLPLRFAFPHHVTSADVFQDKERNDSMIWFTDTEVSTMIMKSVIDAATVHTIAGSRLKFMQFDAFDDEGSASQLGAFVGGYAYSTEQLGSSDLSALVVLGLHPEANVTRFAFQSRYYDRVSCIRQLLESTTYSAVT